MTDTINLPAGSRSQQIKITPDGTKAYVAIQDSNAVAVINTVTKTLASIISGGFSSPHGIAITPDGTKAYVTNHGLGGSGSSVTVINLATDTATTTVGVGSAPIGVAATSEKVYVANNLSNSISVISTVTDAVIATVPIIDPPFFKQLLILMELKPMYLQAITHQSLIPLPTL